MNKILLPIAALLLSVAGCSGARKSAQFRPITSNGEACLVKCNKQKADCLLIGDGDISESEKHACEDAYGVCLKPCVEFDEMIQKAF